MFPVKHSYPKNDDISQIAKSYVSSVRELREFGEGKEKVGFKSYDYHPMVQSFEDKTPRPQSPKRKGIWAKLFS